MTNRQQDNQPGPWERDELGRKFRRVGNTIEYAPTITTSYGIFPMGEVPKPREVKEKKPKEWGKCPFNSRCTQHCARYTDKGCGIVTGEGPAPGRRCPFGNKTNPTTCKETCAFWTLCSRKEANERTL